MRSRLVNRLALAASLAAALSVGASVSPAAAVTLGQLAPGSPPLANCSSGPVDLLNPTVGSGNSYIIPATGGVTDWTVTSWSHNAAAGLGQTVKMKLFRKVGEPDRYQVVAHDGPRALTPSTVNSFATNLQVKPGDLLGLNDANASTVPNACLFSAPGGFAYARVGDLPDGQAETFILDAVNVLYNVSAVVEPTNSFSLGTITRNKKKGTATVTVQNLPNPGELTGSGKGVKASSVSRAVTSKSVGPGQAQLLIKAKGKKKRKLNRTGKVKLSVAITYTPTGGSPNTQSIKVKLKKNL